MELAVDLHLLLCPPPSKLPAPRPTLTSLACMCTPHMSLTCVPLCGCGPPAPGDVRHQPAPAVTVTTGNLLQQLPLLSHTLCALFCIMLVCVQVLYGINQRLRVEDVDSPLCEVRPVKSVLLVVLTGDRGLCGGYNNFIIKRVSPSGGSTGLRGECGGWGDARQQG